MIADIHCHPSLPVLNTNADMWNYHPPTPEERRKAIITTAINGFTQGDCTSLCKADVRLVLNTFYPVEHGFLDSPFPAIQRNSKNGFLKALWKGVERFVDRGTVDCLSELYLRAVARTPVQIPKPSQFKAPLIKSAAW